MAKKEKKKWRIGGHTRTQILLFPGPGTRDLPALLPALEPCGLKCREHLAMPPFSCCLPALEGARF